MNTEAENLLLDPVFKNFHIISQIPRASMQEQKISSFLMQWAKERGLEARQDDSYNVLINKPASAGYENAPTVMLQAHLDMVCEKATGSTHDFSRDPIIWEIEDDLLSTGGRTTLGADNGIGVAYIMAVLEDSNLEHPALEAVFTTKEEFDLSGAMEFDTSWLHSSYLINLDHGCEDEILCGSCGGTGIDLHLPEKKETIPQDWSCYTVSLSGLRGGHSGEDIHRGHGNANLLLLRTLRALEKEIDFLVCSLTGGTFRTVIPRSAQCVLALPSHCVQKAQTIVQNMHHILGREYESVSPEFALSFLASPTNYDWGYPVHRLIRTLMLSPDGIWEMSSDVVGLVDSSDNMGELYLEEEGYRIVYEIRCANDSTKEYLMDVLAVLAETVGGTCVPHSGYPTWYYRPDSPLRKAAETVFYRLRGREPRKLIVHAGLECGCFFATKPELDAISIGPNCWYFHSPDEKLSISSAKRVWEFLTQLLRELKE